MEESKEQIISWRDIESSNEEYILYLEDQIKQKNLELETFIQTKKIKIDILKQKIENEKQLGSEGDQIYIEELQGLIKEHEEQETINTQIRQSIIDKLRANQGELKKELLIEQQEENICNKKVSIIQDAKIEQEIEQLNLISETTAEDVLPSERNQEKTVEHISNKKKNKKKSNQSIAKGQEDLQKQIMELYKKFNQQEQVISQLTKQNKNLKNVQKQQSNQILLSKDKIESLTFQVNNQQDKILSIKIPILRSSLMTLIYDYIAYKNKCGDWVNLQAIKNNLLQKNQTLENFMQKQVKDKLGISNYDWEIMVSQKKKQNQLIPLELISIIEQKSLFTPRLKEEKPEIGQAFSNALDALCSCLKKDKEEEEEANATIKAKDSKEEQVTQ